MTLDKPNERIAMHVDLGSVYNRAAAKMVPGEVDWGYSQAAVDEPIRDHNLEKKWQINANTKFTSAFSK